MDGLDCIYSGPRTNCGVLGLFFWLVCARVLSGCNRGYLFVLCRGVLSLVLIMKGALRCVEA